MPKKFNFAPDLPAQPISFREIENRLTKHLRKLRAAQVSELPQDDLCEPMHAFQLAAKIEPTNQDLEKIERRARALHEANTARTGQLHLKPEDWRRLEPARHGIFLEGPTSEHRADEIAADLLSDLPWMRRPIELIWRDMRAYAAAGEGLRFRPILLDGPPSVGKTYLARKLAALSGVPEVFIDIGAGSDGFRLAGSSRNWGRSTPGRVVETILAKRIGNPVVFIDEVEKAGTLHSTSGFSTSVTTSLLGMLEPSSARLWECPYYAMPFDLSRVNWILAANDADRISRPLLSRCRLVHIDPLSLEDLIEFAARQVAKRGMDEEVIEVVARILTSLPEDHVDYSLRGVLRVLDDIQALAKMPRLS